MKKFLAVFVLLVSGCGLKVVNPEEEKNKGTKALDFSGGGMRLVDTYTCSLVAGNGKRVSAVAKTESEARTEAILRCKDQTLISICRPENVRCNKN